MLTHVSNKRHLYLYCILYINKNWNTKHSRNIGTIIMTLAICKMHLFGWVFWLRIRERCWVFEISYGKENILSIFIPSHCCRVCASTGPRPPSQKKKVVRSAAWVDDMCADPKTRWQFTPCLFCFRDSAWSGQRLTRNNQKIKLWWGFLGCHRIHTFYPCTTGRLITDYI